MIGHLTSNYVSNINKINGKVKNLLQQKFLIIL